MSTVLKWHSRMIFHSKPRKTVWIESTQNKWFSEQMVLRTVRQEAGTRERQPKAFKTKLAQGGPSDQIHSDQMVLVKVRREARPWERWPEILKGELENSSRKPMDLN
jgi:hypothetical protein